MCSEHYPGENSRYSSNFTIVDCQCNELDGILCAIELRGPKNTHAPKTKPNRTDLRRNLSTDDCYAESTSIRVNILGSTDASGAMRPMWCRYNNKRLTFVYCFRFGQEECSDSILIHTHTRIPMYAMHPMCDCFSLAHTRFKRTAFVCVRAQWANGCMCGMNPVRTSEHTDTHTDTHTHARSCIHTSNIHFNTVGTFCSMFRRFVWRCAHRHT